MEGRRASHGEVFGNRWSGTLSSFPMAPCSEGVGLGAAPHRARHPRHPMLTVGPVSPGRVRTGSRRRAAHYSPSSLRQRSIAATYGRACQAFFPAGGGVREPSALTLMRPPLVKGQRILKRPPDRGRAAWWGRQRVDRCRALTWVSNSDNRTCLHQTLIEALSRCQSPLQGRSCRVPLRPRNRSVPSCRPKQRSGLNRGRFSS
jgi:hypothetical protein